MEIGQSTDAWNCLVVHVEACGVVLASLTLIFLPVSSLSVVLPCCAVAVVRKKKKKKKKSNADASEAASPDDSAGAAASTAVSAGPSSSITSTASTPAFTASSATLDSFDAFAPSSHAANGASSFGSNVSFAGQPANAAAVTAPGDADKPKKSRKGKKGAEATAASTVASSTAAQPGMSVSVGGDYDLTNFAAIPTPRGAGSGDIDILTGTNAPSGRLEDMFASATIMDEPLDANGEEDDGFAVEEEPALLDMISSQTAEGTMVSPRGSGGMTVAAEPQKPKDVWDLAQDFTNIDNLKGTVEKKKASQREEVSMSMMRGMQPFGGGSSISASAAAPSAPAAAPSPFFSAPPAGMNAFGGMQGMGGGFGAPMGGMTGGPMGMPAASPFGGMPGGMPGGFGMVPQAGAGGGMGGYGGMGGFGAPPPSGPATNDLPFAAAPTTASRTKMPANGRPLVFDAVPAARQMGQPMASIAAQAQHGPAGPNWNR